MITKYRIGTEVRIVTNSICRGCNGAGCVGRTGVVKDFITNYDKVITLHEACVVFTDRRSGYESYCSTVRDDGVMLANTKELL
jgi:hypothetical protein